MTIVNFTPWSALAGGAIIGAASALTWWGLGRIAGISNIFGQLLAFERGHLSWRLAFLGALVLVGAAAKLALGDGIAFELRGGAWQMIVAGLLVGYGTQLGSGCTSGHGICGMGRLSPRSIVATLCFMATGAIAVFAIRQAGLL
jgi:uncharacterized membrane protein YedE/YeeE